MVKKVNLMLHVFYHNFFNGEHSVEFVPCSAWQIDFDTFYRKSSSIGAVLIIFLKDIWGSG